MNFLFAYFVALASLFAHAQNVNVSVPLTEEDMIRELAIYSDEAIGLCNQQARATWNSVTDVGNKLKEDEKVTIFNKLRFAFIFFLSLESRGTHIHACTQMAISENRNAHKHKIYFTLSSLFVRLTSYKIQIIQFVIFSKFKMFPFLLIFHNNIGISS